MKFLKYAFTALLMLLPMTAYAVQDLTPQTSEALKNAKGLVAIEFYLEECPACKQMAPMLEEAEQQFKGRITFFKINLDKYPQVGAAFGVQAVPSLLIVDQSKNKVLFMGTGVPPSQAEFTKMLDLVLLKSLEK